MQRPTCTMLRVRTPSDAHVIFHAVSLNLLPIVARRLDTEERRAISSGCVFVWEERGSNAESTGLGIERWTDSIRWGPSRVKDEFLFYHEKEPDTTDLELASESNAPVTPHHYSRGFYRENLIKQTYSVFVETPRGRRKWHLIAYFTQESLEFLHTIDDIPGLASLHVPPGKYKSARSAKNNNKSSASPVYEPTSAINPFRDISRSPYPPRHQVLTAPTYYNPAILDTNRRLPTLSTSERRNPSLAPLAYLENIPPPRRHPVDEEALMSFSGLPV
ncbi:Gti1/Pac2 family-domain-containing protein [Lentinula raphanica]|nr:Gti1/Pac2 family-domain-containing protein [Lentinula raphanica]KAJ3768628.1 Gti1/Pac2 family-domain-containing protein [Lentinula raphanica]KAJ3825363.1 Gti1/Pac2 family-domain-containing protein [Lentinula raphanica]KAJ3970502.1 Gti1/Pac2 family-domain-containing protein [Lentinula raphanica]